LLTPDCTWSCKADGDKRLAIWLQAQPLQRRADRGQLVKIAEEGGGEDANALYLKFLLIS